MNSPYNIYISNFLKTLIRIFITCFFVVFMLSNTILLLGTFTVNAATLSPLEVHGAQTITSEEAFGLFRKGVLFLDVRKESDWEAGRIPDAVHLDLKRYFTQQNLQRIAQFETPIVIYCNAAKCLRSSQASAKAVSWGYQKVYYYRDGFPLWKNAMYPTE